MKHVINNTELWPNNILQLYKVYFSRRVMCSNTGSWFSELFIFLPFIQLNSTRPSDHTHFSVIQLQFMLYFHRPGLTAMHQITQVYIGLRWKCVFVLGLGLHLDRQRDKCVDVSLIGENENIATNLLNWNLTILHFTATEYTYLWLLTASRFVLEMRSARSAYQLHNVNLRPTRQSTAILPPALHWPTWAGGSNRHRDVRVLAVRRLFGTV